MTALVPVDMPGLDILEVGCRYLAQARTLQDTIDVRDWAETARSLYRKRKLSLTAMNDAAEVKLRAERQLGELLKKNGFGEKGGNRKSSCIVQLDDMGIEKTLSHRCQRIASIAPSKFERHILDVRNAEDELTTAGALRLAKEDVKAAKKESRKRQEVESGKGCTVDDLHQAIRQGRRWGCIYADPPWSYGNTATRASTGNHYETMSLDDIKAMPVGKLAAETCHLHLWATNPLLLEALEVMRAWGFTYKQNFCWCKGQMGMGNYWRSSHEILLLGVRGSEVFADHSLMSWAVIDRGKHSSKPAQVRMMLERASPSPRLELFARMKADGWDAWGNEIEKDLFNQEG